MEQQLHTQEWEYSERMLDEISSVCIIKGQCSTMLGTGIRQVRNDSSVGSDHFLVLTMVNAEGVLW